MVMSIGVLLGNFRSVLICAFGSAFADRWFSNAAAHFFQNRVSYLFDAFIEPVDKTYAVSYHKYIAVPVLIMTYHAICLFFLSCKN